MIQSCPFGCPKPRSLVQLHLQLLVLQPLRGKRGQRTPCDWASDPDPCDYSGTLYPDPHTPGRYEPQIRSVIIMESTLQSFFVSAEVISYFTDKTDGKAGISVLLTAAYGFFSAKVDPGFRVFIRNH
jgi:hypothetical protein